MIYYNKNIVKKFQNSGVLSEEEAPFNPEGDSYDYDTAIKYGLGPDETGHWPSRIPQTGQLLKGSKHKTFHKTAEGEAKAGYKIYKGPDGKYYSRKDLRQTEAKPTSSDTGLRPVHLKKYDPDRPKYHNATPTHESIGEPSSKRAYELNKVYVEGEETPIRDSIITGLDVITDIAQLGSFIPHPVPQYVGAVGNSLGAYIDAAQAINSLSRGDTQGALINTASTILPSFLGKRAFRRNSKYLNKNNLLYWTQRGARRKGLIAQPDRIKYINTAKTVRGMDPHQLAINRALLSSVLAETAYDASEAPFLSKPLVPRTKY